MGNRSGQKSKGSSSRLVMLLQIVILSCLAFICCQDLLCRAVYWWCFPVLAILMGVLKYNLLGLEHTLIDVAYGLFFLITQLFILWIYFSAKHKKLINITDNYLGWGDVLFLIAIPFYLSPVNYVLFYVVSLILVLLYALTTTKLITNNKHIPLAGLQAALLGIAMIIDYAVPNLVLYEDNWMYFLIN